MIFVMNTLAIERFLRASSVNKFNNNENQVQLSIICNFIIDTYIL
jgi:hypothetical protein